MWEATVITYLDTSLFDSPAQTLVNTVNTVGVMGKGVAKAFKEIYPKMFREYKSICDTGHLKIGILHLWKSEDRWVVNFPTKTTWRLPSKLEYIEAGLRTFASNYAQLGITSVSFPPLGCGNGNLDWTEVRPLMERYLKGVSIPVYIHNVHVAQDFRAEHVGQVAPASFSEFWQDIKWSIREQNGQYLTTDSQRPFFVSVDDSRALHIRRDGGKCELLQFEELETAWVAMRDGILSIDRYPDEKSRRYRSYLFPILATLPYVRVANVSRDGEDARRASKGLFFPRNKGASAAPPVETQECLSL
jgi:O-acetyl-ADP-ribose deacetylase (regulator of RNase III)